MPLLQSSRLIVSLGISLTSQPDNGKLTGRPSTKCKSATITIITYITLKMVSAIGQVQL